MKNRISKLLKWTNQHKGITIFFVLVIIVVGGWVLINLTPRPLGSDLTYLGRENYGNIFGFDAQPSVDYYYSTDMSFDELKSYFKDVKVDEPDISISFQKILNFTDGKESFYVYYYWNKDNAPFSTDKKAIISIDGKDYFKALKYLK